MICQLQGLNAYTYLVDVLHRVDKPTDNAFIESFNGSFQAECLNASWFLSLEDARTKCEAWRTENNEVRPLSSISQKTPIELAKTQGFTP